MHCGVHLCVHVVTILSGQDDDLGAVDDFEQLLKDVSPRIYVLEDEAGASWVLESSY
ncbi:hypothetical protein K439DRAFT_1641392 [Ramaria rubella]|nr:hypothetical protein K439DRAFT_1641390 [Ramaria rubella]KAF8575469.1 hypothetical protein K439DRAFT_1641392 [Ramaria rubella]